jgi:hypothetical protein
MLGVDFEKRMEHDRNKAKDLAEADCREFFCHMATDYYVGKMTNEIGRIEDEFLREAVRYPFKSIVKVPVATMNTYWSSVYSNQQVMEDRGSSECGLFRSPSGWTRRNIYRIFKETDFRHRVIKRLGLSERFFLTMTAEELWSDDDNASFKTTIWLNFRMS